MNPISVIPSLIVGVLAIILAIKKIRDTSREAGNNIFDTIKLLSLIILVPIYCIYNFGYIHKYLYIVAIPTILFIGFTSLAMSWYQYLGKTDEKKTKNTFFDLIACALSIIVIMNSLITIYSDLNYASH